MPVATLDVLHKLIADDDVVVLKCNPTLEYLGPFMARAFKPLIDAGYVAVTYGGGDVGKHLANHPKVTCFVISQIGRIFSLIVCLVKFS